jgi:hypothetical protein
MSILVSGQPQTEWTRLTANTATVIYTADKRTTITAIAASENNGGTPTLAIWRTKGATDYYLRSALAVTARQRVLIDEVLVLDQGDTLKAQSNDASGHFDVTVTHLAPSALANR